MNVWLAPPATGTATGGILLDLAGNVILCDTCPCDIGTGTGTGCCQPDCSTLVATISNVSNCAKPDGDEVTLTESSPGIWNGSHPTLGSLTLQCDPVGCSGSQAQRWELTLDCPSVSGDQRVFCANATSSCNPFSLDFGPVTIKASDLACCGFCDNCLGSSAQFSINIQCSAGTGTGGGGGTGTGTGSGSGSGSGGYPGA